MADEVFQSDAFDGNFQINYTASFAIQEGADKASFAAGVYGTASFAIMENGPDTASVLIKGANNVTFALVNPKDTVSFSANAKTPISFSIIEKQDIVVFQAMAAAVVILNVVDPTDVVYFRSFAAFFTEGDAAYIPVYPENRVITIRPALDRQPVREPQFAGVKSIPSENRTIRVEQRTLRKDEL